MRFISSFLPSDIHTYIHTYKSVSQDASTDGARQYRLSAYVEHTHRPLSYIFIYDIRYDVVLQVCPVDYLSRVNTTKMLIELSEYTVSVIHRIHGECNTQNTQ